MFLPKILKEKAKISLKKLKLNQIYELVKDKTPLFGKIYEKRFRKKWRTRPIVAGQFFNLQALERLELDLKYYTDYQGWSSFLQIKETYYPRSIVKGTEIVLDVDFIAKNFKLPTDGFKSYGSDWYSQANVTIEEVREPLFKPETPKDKYTTPYIKLLPKFFNIISKGNIMPRQGKYDALAMPSMNDQGPSNPQPHVMPNLPRSKTERNTERIKRDIKKLFQGQQLLDNHLSYITMENSIMRDWFRNMVCYLYNLPYPELNPYPPPVHTMPQPFPSSSFGDSTPTNQEP
ncbi:hypothetical protein TSUD_61610 [Trifolium subterraneum]|uniref:Uncharacterized protein n=1 Tax=Trifolium subterraneum TaxID=3900 RepID=A0A2Z6NUF3_TRISU|nr:hypothetical protein TSUD_61610 [Trifolium subterraneum]